jgi:hypothetical protein
MGVYTLTKPIPACRVPKELLTRLENYILQRASDFNTEKVHYKVTISDSSGNLQVNRVEEIHFPVLDDTESIQLSLGNPYTTNLGISISFSISPPEWLGKSKLEVHYQGESARETAQGIAAEIIRHIRAFSHPTIIRKIRSTLTMAVSLLVFFLFFFSLFLFTKAEPALRTAAVVLLTLGALLASYLYFSATTPYCLFETSSSSRIVDRSKWFWRSVYGIPLFGFTGRLLMKYLLDL